VVFVLTVLIRFFAVLLGCFLVVSSTVDLLGLGYYSTEPPPLGTRAARWIASVAGGLALIVPYRCLRPRSALWLITAGVLMLLVAWTVVREITTIRQYAAGQMSWEGLAISLFVGVIVVANLVVFFSARRT
jgi:hypothetical protein